MIKFGPKSRENLAQTQALGLYWLERRHFEGVWRRMPHSPSPAVRWLTVLSMCACAWMTQRPLSPTLKVWSSLQQPEHRLGAHWQLSFSAGLNQNVRGLGLWLCALTSPPTEPEEGWALSIPGPQMQCVLFRGDTDLLLASGGHQVSHCSDLKQLSTEWSHTSAYS